MGTRALITLNEKPFIATHWDGYPSALGADLLAATKPNGSSQPEQIIKAEIINVAAEHTIDFAVPEVQVLCNAKRFQEIAAKTDGKYTADDLAKLHTEGKQITFGVQAAEDYPIGNIENYGDWAEFQYDYSEGKWRFRELSGAYPDSLSDAAPLKKLTKKICAN